MSDLHPDLTEQIENSLEMCLECGASREALRDMLGEPMVRDYVQGQWRHMETENHSIARHILGNCSTCNAYFEKEKESEHA